MDVLVRGFQSYQVILGGFVVLALVWGVNQYLLKSTAAETGWPILFAIAAALVVSIVGLRRLAARMGYEPTHFTRAIVPREWNSRK